MYRTVPIRQLPAFALVVALLGAAGCAPETPPAAAFQVGYSRGADDAPVTVMEFSDFGCPFCAMFSSGTYPQLHRDYVEPGLVRWVYVPFVIGSFPNGAEAARAGECAADQGRFWQMKERLYAGQREWKAASRAAPVFAGYADDVGLDRRRFDACYDADRGRDRTLANNQAAAMMGVRATPTFIVEGRIVEGSLPIERFRQLFDQILAERGVQP